MHSDNGNGSRAASARGFGALCAVLAMGFGLMARPAAAAPFAYVTNVDDHTVSVIDTATTPPAVVATIPVAALSGEIAITPDGKHVYFVDSEDMPPSGTVSVIDTATNTVVATIPVGIFPLAVAITPDGKHAYVANEGDDNVSVIATATNTVVATVPVVGGASGSPSPPMGNTPMW